MNQDILLLLSLAASIGFIHTILGPDHYLPFIMMSKAGKWSRNKTFLVTFLCGIGHVLSSVLIGLSGVIVGISISKLEAFELLRGNLAAWLLTGFGLAYFVYGIRKIIKTKGHHHMHSHGDGTVHNHTHKHKEEHVHVHHTDRKITPWILFVVFLFGPCEPLIPVLMYPASQVSLSGMILVAIVFLVVTVATMLTVVFAGIYGLSFVALSKLERYTHSIAGAMVLLCGLSILFLGL
jgi:nickel/cobalt transporter (NicO) family protein